MANVSTVTPGVRTIKKRNRNNLESNWRDETYKAVSQVADYWISTERAQVTTEKAVRGHYHAKMASEASHEWDENERHSWDSTENGRVNGKDKKDASFFIDRRIAMKFLFQNIFMSPAKALWHQMKLIPSMCHMLNISLNSHTKVHAQLTRISDLKEAYNGKIAEGSGSIAYIQHGTRQADIIYDCVQKGLSSKETTVVLNVWRDKQEIPLYPICRSAVQFFITQNPCVITSKIQAKKSGKSEEGSEWAIGRCNQANQIDMQIMIGYAAIAGGKDSYDVVTFGLPPIYLDGIVFWDENHQQVSLGDGCTVYQRQVARDEDGKVVAPEDGGELSSLKTTTSIKYPGEGRGCFGVCIRTDKDGKEEGIRAKPFNYTNRKVVGNKAFEIAIGLELERVKSLKNKWGKVGEGYEVRYKENWRKEVEKKVRKSLCSIFDIIDHMIDEGTRIYKGTNREDDWIMFHDGLTCYWTPESQEYIRSKGFYDRQFRCLGETNKGNRYYLKVCGDSPEICRGLDTYGFADFKRFINRMRALTSAYHKDDPRKFKFGTPNEVWHTMERCWTMEPNSARIMADIKELQVVCQQIVEAKGCVLSEISLRHGRRLMAHNGGRVLVHKVRERQRKALLTLGSIHPDAEEALQMLLDGPSWEKLAPADLKEALAIEQEALDAIPVVDEDEEDDINEDLEEDDEMGV
jgi:hypothetical protein